jgi:hypothetical protein
VVFDEANGLPQYRSTHAKALLQSLFGAERFADGPAAANDIRLDVAGNLRSQFVRPAGVRLETQLRLNCTLPQVISACQQHASRDGPAAHGHHADLGTFRHLALPRLAAQL